MSKLGLRSDSNFGTIASLRFMYQAIARLPFGGVLYSHSSLAIENMKGWLLLLAVSVRINWVRGAHISVPS